MPKSLLVVVLPALFAVIYFGFAQTRRIPQLDRHVERLLRLVPFAIFALLICLLIGAHVAGSEKLLATFQRFLLWLHE